MSETELDQPELQVRDGYMEGVTCWVDTDLPDPNAGTEFYGGLFGWEFEDRMPADAAGNYFVAQLRGLDVAAVGSRPDEADWSPAWNTYIWVESADEAAAKVKAAGGAVVMEPFDIPGAGRMAAVADPQGAAFNVWEAREHKGAQLVNYADTLELQRADDERSRGCGRLLRRGVRLGGVRGTGWLPVLRGARLRGFPGALGPHAATPAGRGRRPGRVRETRPRGSASMEGQPEGTPPNWGVNFAVDDADAKAARATELGGKVLVEPFDAPPVRMAVISDPQGAVFSVSKYTPAQRLRRVRRRGLHKAPI